MSLTDASLSTFSERSSGVFVSKASPFHDAKAVGTYKVELIWLNNENECNLEHSEPVDAVLEKWRRQVPNRVPTRFKRLPHAT